MLYGLIKSSLFSQDRTQVAMCFREAWIDSQSRRVVPNRLIPFPLLLQGGAPGVFSLGVRRQIQCNSILRNGLIIPALPIKTHAQVDETFLGIRVTLHG